jgi:Ankyrin repeats (3 copies)
LPRTLKVLVALGDPDGVRECFDASGALRTDSGSSDERAAVHNAFICACRFQHKAIASMLLERCIALDSDLGRRVDGGPGRDAFLEYLCGDAHRLDGTAVASGSPWQAFVMDQVLRAISDNDLPEFTRLLESESWLLGDSCVSPQIDMLERAAFSDRGPFMARLLDLDPAVLHCPTPPRSSALVFALEYGHAHLVPLLTRIWPLPDDLPHAVSVGNFERVKRWFDAAGQPALGNPNDHYPGNDSGVRANLGGGPATAQQILDVALAWACMNRRLEIASFLLDHGADINTRWSTHEPASILHECALHNNYEAAKFLIDHGIDMTICDHRWGGTAEDWARYAAQNEEMADFLAAAEQEQMNRK